MQCFHCHFQIEQVEIVRSLHSKKDDVSMSQAGDETAEVSYNTVEYMWDDLPDGQTK